MESFNIELNDFDGSIIIEFGVLENPISHLFQLLFVFWIRDPDLNELNILFDFGSDPIDVEAFIDICCQEGQHNAFPNTIALIFVESQHEGSSLLVAGVLPNGFDIVLEDV